MLHHSNSDNGLISFQLRKGNLALPLEQWTEAKNTGADVLLGWLEQHEQDGVTRPDTSTMAVTPKRLMDALAEDNGQLRQALDLPGYFTGVLSLSDDGALDNENYRIDYSWLTTGGRHYTSVNEKGCFVEIAGALQLMPPHIWRITEEVKNIRSMTTRLAGERLLHIHAIQSLLQHLPEDAHDQIKKGGRIGRLRLYYADAFQIEAESTDDGYTVVPVLKQAGKGVYNEQERVFSDLLTRADLEAFHHHFRESTTMRAHYTLEAGRYLVLSPKVHRALEVVHKVRAESGEKRLAFLQNPRKRFEEELGEDFSGEVLDAIFSDRVVGFGEKQKRIIPWIMIEGQIWWPPEETADKAPWPRYIKIDDKDVPFENPQKLAEFEKQAMGFCESGAPSFDYEGFQIPADTQLLESIRALKPNARPDQKTTSTENKKNEPVSAVSAPSPKKSSVLYIKENLQEKEYEVLLIPRRVPKFTMPAAVKSQPKEHQKQGIEWLAQHYRAGTRGVLLADDMGLGKTFQVLVTMAWIRELMDKGALSPLPMLVVAPTGLLENWIIKEHDVHLFAPGIGEPVRAYGKWLKDLKRNWKLGQASWVLTTYETLASYQWEFVREHYSVVVFDEMQKVKNPDTLATIAAKALNADFWIGMTGTPVENRLCDLWCIMDTLVPGLLGSIKEFSHRYEKAVTAKPPNEEELERLNHRVRKRPHSENAPAIMLRRMKKEVLDSLPKKHLHPLREIMPPLQAEHYSSALEQAKTRQGEPGAALQALQAMRYLSLHPHYQTPVMYDGDEVFIEQSARLKAMFKELDRIALSGEKALIFLEPEKWHGEIPSLLKRRYRLENLPMIIMGDVKGSDRQKRVNMFQSGKPGFDVMLLSPRAGGVGLTVTAANHVFHLTRWWNPAVEDQATDRIYRIGQEREVHVYYPMAEHPSMGEHSFDLVLDRLLEKKRKLSERVLWPPAGSQEDSDYLANEVLWGKAGDAGAISYQDILAMHERQYVDHVRQVLQRQLPWLRVEKCITSHDGGADTVIKNRDGLIVALVQIKHSNNRDSTPSACEDLKRALKHYYSHEPWCIGITSALRFQARDYEWQNAYPKALLITGADAVDCEKAADKLRDYL
jgi:predicted CopG family antitoxin